MEENKIKELLKAMNYMPKNCANNVYTKDYPSHDNYSIEVDFNSKKINYGDKIIFGNTTTSNFSKPENFVVLECINRLLEKGYKPENIELEKIYPSGHGHSGNLDILIHSIDRKSFLMIECKTFGSEFNKEYKNMLKNGGQLFTYYALDRNVQYLCLYSSRFVNGKIEYKNNIINVNEDWRGLSTSEEIYLHWNKSFKDNGIFEQDAMPYIIKHKALTYEMLIDLKEEDSGKIFNQIMEILRHNVVSDKPNAFNKLLNLFVCKIIDENKNETDELKFQWLDSDTDESLQMRLNDLYKDGMWRFLNINVTDYTERQVDEVLQGIEENDNLKQIIKNMLINTRLKKSPNFAFKEVLDEKSFKANAKIVKEIVELLQGYKFRYKQKHQFLGDFFELLLNTSMKQEAGQFFTPVPITRFIISSLPIKESISEKIKNSNNDNDILPTVIDYAMGSGHFLTEYMEQVQNIINDIDESKSVPTVRNKIKTWRESERFSWAKDYVYGIDLDDRLVKTAKVSAFFNGDGEANVIWANGLANFLSDEYRKKLKYVEPFNNKNNGQFDILISNPPYSVEAFKATLKDGEKSFDLYNYLTDNSKEIECLFVERMKQLLKVGGWAGVILPVSILSNSGIYSKTREIIFKYFKVRAIVELGSGTFMKTGTNTIILFLERRQDNEYKELEKSISVFFENSLDITVNKIENAFSKFVSNVYDDLTFDDYVKIIKGNKVNHELYNDYKKEFNENIEKIRQTEKEKMLYFLLTYNQEIVLIKTGQKQKEKEFLGYEFSERRGHEGLKKLPSGTKLYNENNLLDETKANYYIYNSFKGIKTNIDLELTENISYTKMSDLFEYGTSKFDKRVNLNKKKISIDTKYNMITIGEISENIINGSTPSKTNYSYWNKAEVKWATIKDFKDDNIFIEKTEKYITNKAIKEHKARIVPKNSVLVSCTATIGKASINNADLATNQQINAIVCNEKILPCYLAYWLRNYGYDLQNLTDNLGVKHVNLKMLKNYKIPLPPKDIQQKIIDEYQNIDKRYSSTRLKIEAYKKRISGIFDRLKMQDGEIISISRLCKDILAGGDIPKTDFSNTITEKYNVPIYANGNDKNALLGYTNIERVTEDAITISARGTIGFTELRKAPFYPAVRLIVLIPNKEIVNDIYMKYALQNTNIKGNGQVIQQLTVPMIEQQKIIVPTLSKQNEIAKEIKKIDREIEKLEQALVKIENEKKNIFKKYL